MQVLDVTNVISVPVGSIQIIGGIPSGGSGMAQVLYDTTGLEGERTIQVVVDPANLIVEGAEDDNQVELTLTVGPPVDEPSVQPNLVMTSSSVVYTPTTPMPGDIVTLTVSVYNNGGSAANGVVVRVMDVTGDTPTQVGDDVIIPSIAVSESMSVTLPYDTTGMEEGNRTLTASADPDNVITESNENDNTSTVTIPLGTGGGEPTTTPEPTETGGPTASPEPTEPGEPTTTPEPTEPGESTATAEPTETGEPSVTPEPTASGAPTATPEPTTTEGATATPNAADPRAELPAPGLEVQMAEDLNKRDDVSSP